MNLFNIAQTASVRDGTMCSDPLGPEMCVRPKKNMMALVERYLMISNPDTRPKILVLILDHQIFPIQEELILTTIRFGHFAELRK